MEDLSIPAEYLAMSNQQAAINKVLQDTSDDVRLFMLGPFVLYMSKHKQKAEYFRQIRYHQDYDSIAKSLIFNVLVAIFTLVLPSLLMVIYVDTPWFKIGCIGFIIFTNMPFFIAWHLCKVGSFEFWCSISLLIGFVSIVTIVPIVFD